MKLPVKNLDVVALLADVPEAKLARGQVGTVVEKLDAKHVLVEFVNDQGRTYAIAPVDASKVLVLHYEPVEACYLNLPMTANTSLAKVPAPRH